MDWTRLSIAIIAGDRREQEIARCAQATGATVRAFGFPWPEGGIAGVTRCASAEEALAGADIALFPIPGIAADGALFAPAHEGRLIPTREMLAGMKAPANIILGWADAKLKAHCEALAITLHEYEWDDDLMLLRGPAIVEGMLRVIIENTDITIHRARVVMLGHGTIGGLACRALVGLGARVHVVARNPVQRAEAYAAGAEPHQFSALPEVLPGADIVLSSIPARVLNADALALLPKHALLVDLAAPPGGMDRDASATLGRRGSRQGGKGWGRSGN